MMCSPSGGGCRHHSDRGAQYAELQPSQAGRQKLKAHLLKRGMSATIDEFLMAAEHIMCQGNHRIILCERGVRTFADHSRNTLDLSAIPASNLSHLPIIADPSHAAGRRDQVIPLSRASVAVGADGLMVEVHHDPTHALSDGPQSLYPEQFEELMRQVRILENPHLVRLDLIELAVWLVELVRRWCNVMVF